MSSVSNVKLLDPYVTVNTATINQLTGPHIIFAGANLHVRSGGGSTDATVNGLGNLIVGYNEEISGTPMARDGSHNLIVGPAHRWTSYGGFVTRSHNYLDAPHASVSGGWGNRAMGDFSSVSGGDDNQASGDFSSVCGGESVFLPAGTNSAWAAGAYHTP